MLAQTRVAQVHIGTGCVILCRRRYKLVAIMKLCADCRSGKQFVESQLRRNRHVRAIEVGGSSENLLPL